MGMGLLLGLGNTQSNTIEESVESKIKCLWRGGLQKNITICSKFNRPLIAH